jgi:signal transduction histidine kinase
MALGVVALLVGMRQTLTRGVQAAATMRAEDTATALRAAARPGDVTLAERGDIIQVLDGQGAVVASSPGIAGRPAVARLRPGESTRTVPPFDDGEYLVVAAASGPLTVIVARSLEPVDDSVQVVVNLLAIGLPVLLLIVGVTTWTVAGRALAPVDAIRGEVEEISAARLHRRVPKPPGGDEVARLATTMNHMLDRLERAQARQRRFVSDASHELRSPVAAIRQHAEVAVAHPDRTTLAELAETVLAEDLRVQRLVEDLLLLARADEHTLEPRRRPVDVDDLVFAEARRLREATPLRIDVTAVSAGRVSGDPAALRRALRNLADNAVRHAHGTVAFGLSERDARVVLDVDDDGPGVPAADRERVFERFVRLDDARARDAGGSGLGLAIVTEVTAAHGGRVTMTESPLGGTRVEITFPVLAD